MVDYKELETNIFSPTREGGPLTGRGGALIPLIKKLLEASLESEIENLLKVKEIAEEMGEIQRLYAQAQDHLSC